VFGKTTVDKTLDMLFEGSKDSPVSAKSIADQFGVSVTRVRHILIDARSRGLAIRMGQQGWFPGVNLKKEPVKISEN
jgi:biotin operon repressor